MERIIKAAMILTLLPAFLTGCTRCCDCSERCHNEREMNVLWDRHDCWHRHPNPVVPREFFDAGDFRPDSMYGYTRGRHDGDCSRYHEGRSRYHRTISSRHRRHYNGSECWRNCDDDVSERYLPPPAPDMDYDE